MKKYWDKFFLAFVRVGQRRNVKMCFFVRCIYFYVFKNPQRAGATMIKAQVHFVLYYKRAIFYRRWIIHARIRMNKIDTNEKKKQKSKYFYLTLGTSQYLYSFYVTSNNFFYSLFRFFVVLPHRQTTKFNWAPASWPILWMLVRTGDTTIISWRLCWTTCPIRWKFSGLRANWTIS